MSDLFRDYELIKELDEPGLLYQFTPHPTRLGYVVPHGYDLDLSLQSVGGGWANIIRRLWDVKPEGVRVEQVKEKFGGLRFYTSPYLGENDPWEKAIVAAGREADETCEKCGRPGLLRTSRPGGHWLKTLCESEGGGEPLGDE